MKISKIVSVPSRGLGGANAAETAIKYFLKFVSVPSRGLGGF